MCYLTALVSPYRGKPCPRPWMHGLRPAASVRTFETSGKVFSIRTSCSVISIYESYSILSSDHAQVVIPEVYCGDLYTPEVYR